MKRVYLFIIFFVGLASIYAQQQYDVTGKVMDLHDYSPMSDAKIKLGKWQQMTNAKGEFTFKNIPNGNYTLTASHEECNPVEKEIKVDGENLNVEILIEHHVEELEAITLHNHHINEITPIEKMDKQTINQNSTQNLGNFLSQTSGVGALKTGNTISKPIIHGLYGSRISILNDGVRMADQEWGAEHAPNVDINQFEHIDVIKGASALRYSGDASGGVILLEPNKFQKKDSLMGRFSISGYENGRGVDTHLSFAQTSETGKFVYVAGRYKKSGDLRAPDYYLWNTGADENTFLIRLGQQNYKKGIIGSYSLVNQNIGIYRGSHIGNIEDFFKVINSKEPLYKRDFSYQVDNPKQEIQHHIAKLSAYTRVKKIGKLSLDYNFQYNHRKEYDLRRGDLYDVPSMDLELFTNQLNFNQLLERKNWSLENGFLLGYQYNYSTTKTQARRLIPNYAKNWIGGYSIYKRKLSKHWKTEMGLRYEYHRYNVNMWYDAADWENKYAANYGQFFVSKNDENRVFTKPELTFDNWSWMAQLQYAPNSQNTLAFTYAKVSRLPNIAELFSDGLHHSAAVVEEGDLGLNNEDGHQFSLNWELHSKEKGNWQFNVNPYYYYFKSFINQVPTGVQNTIRGVFPVWSYQQVEADMFGVDADFMAQFATNWQFNSRFSYVYGQDLSNDVPLMMMQPAQWNNKLKYTHRSSFPIYVGLEQATTFRQNRYPIYNPDFDYFENGVKVNQTLDLSTPPDAYTLFHLTMGYAFKNRMDIGLTINNMFNTKYRDYLNRLRYFSDAMGRNIILTLNYQW